MENEPVSLKIDNNLVKGILEKRLEAEIVTALGDPTELIGNVVRAALRQKVDSEGNKSRYSSDNSHDFIEIMCRRTIQQMAKDSFLEWLNHNKSLIKKAVLAELKKPQRQKSLALAFANAVETSLDAKWNFTCQIQLIEK